MDHPILVPATADGALEVTMVSWIKKPGDSAIQGEDLAEAATEKITLYITAPADGVLKSILIAEGEKANVGDMVGILAGNEEK